MSNAQPEPSMEEILASIRRIISEDEEEARAPQAASAAAPRPKPAAAPMTPPAQQTVSAAPAAPRPQAATVEVAQTPARPAAEAPARPAVEAPALRAQPVEVARRPAPQAAPQSVKAAPQNQVDMSEQILSETAVAAASKAFQSLSQKVKVAAGAEPRTLEDLVVDMLRPMIKDWLDAHLPTIVEEKVEAEVKRLARHGR